MTKPAGKTVAAMFGSAAVALAVGLGVAGADVSPSATSPSSSAVPAPPSGGGGEGAVPVQPVGGGGCIVGLNCGCIPHQTCPNPQPRPGTARTNQHNPPAPQNP